MENFKDLNNLIEEQDYNIFIRVDILFFYYIIICQYDIYYKKKLYFYNVKNCITIFKLLLLEIYKSYYVIYQYEMNFLIYNFNDSKYIWAFSKSNQCAQDHKWFIKKKKIFETSRRGKVIRCSLIWGQFQINDIIMAIVQ